jgi:Rad3-related DNA helicase
MDAARDKDNITVAQQNKIRERLAEISANGFSARSHEADPEQAPDQEQRLEALEQAFGANARRVEYPTKMPSPDKLLAENGGIVTGLGNYAREIIEEHREAEGNQPDQTAVNVINLHVATETSHDFSIESKESKKQQAELQETLGDDYDKKEDRPTLNAILSMLGNWQGKTKEERKEFIKTATGGKHDDYVWFWCRETSKDGSDALCVSVSSDGLVEVDRDGVRGLDDRGGALVSGAGEILESRT